MAGEYSLLDQTILDKLNRQYQGSPVFTESPNPATAVPAISPELMKFGEQIGTPKPEMDWKQQAVKALQDFGPLISQTGTSLMRGRDVMGRSTETVGSQLGGAVTSALSTMKMNEALRKMIAQQLSSVGGGVGGGAGFIDGQPLGLSSAETVGLTPEQVTGLYGTGLQLREKELKRPFENIQALSESYSKIMSGEAKPAEIALHTATAQKTLAEIDAMPVKNWQEWQTKELAMQKVRKEMGEIEARTETEKEKPETARVERKKTEKQTREIEAKLDPGQSRLLKFAETVGWERVDRGNVIELRDKASGALMTTLQVGAKPEAGAEVKARKAEMDLSKAAMVRIAPLAVRYLDKELAAMPGGKQKVDLANLISSLRGYTGEIDPGVTLAKASPELQEKFNNLIDIYSRTSGLSETRFGSIVHTIFGGEGGAPTPTEKPTGKKVVEKFKSRPGAAAPTPKPTSTQLAPEVYAAMLRESKKGKGTWGFGAWEVDWDGKDVIAIRPRRKTVSTTPPTINPYGTF